MAVVTSVIQISIGQDMESLHTPARQAFAPQMLLHVQHQRGLHRVKVIINFILTVPASNVQQIDFYFLLEPAR